MIIFDPPSISGSGEKHAAVFVDRDGVLIANRDGDYVRSEEDIQIIPGSALAVRQLANAGLRVIVVTNQAGVAKRLMTAQQARFVHEEIVRRFAVRDAELWASYLCPHSPVDNCLCRKPRPGMILHAGTRLNINLSRSYMVGDALSDIAAGNAAGVQSHLVLTGRGATQVKLAAFEQLAPTPLHNNLLAATKVILSQYELSSPPAVPDAIHQNGADRNILYSRTLRPQQR